MSGKKVIPAVVPLAPVELIERRIYLVRGQKVMLDSDLAALYRVPTKSLNLAVRRNKDRFPEDFMFELTEQETESLKFQIETSKSGRRYPPYAFTGHGVAMLSSVLRSTRAVQMNILIIRAFVKLREMLATHTDLARKIEDLERAQRAQGQKIDAVYEAVKKLLPAPEKPRRPIGFLTHRP